MGRTPRFMFVRVPYAMRPMSKTRGCDPALYEVGSTRFEKSPKGTAMRPAWTLNQVRGWKSSATCSRSMPWQLMQAFAEKDRSSFTSAPTWVLVAGANACGERFPASRAPGKPHWSTYTDPEKMMPSTAAAGPAQSSAPPIRTAPAPRRAALVILRSVRDPLLDRGDVRRVEQAVGGHRRRDRAAHRRRVAPQLVHEVAPLRRAGLDELQRRLQRRDADEGVVRDAGVEGGERH